MTKIMYLFAAFLFCVSCSGTNPEPEPGPGPEPTYKNTFTLVGPQFRAEDKLAVVDMASGQTIGTATLTSGEGTERCTWELKTNSDAGITVRVFSPSSFNAGEATLSSVQTFADKGGELYPQMAIAWSDAVKLDKSWPTEFTLSSPATFIRLTVPPVNGTALEGGSLKSIRIDCPGKALSGAFSPDFGACTITPLSTSAQWVEASFGTALALGAKEVSFPLCVFPVDLRGTSCSFIASLQTKGGQMQSIFGSFKGRNLESGAENILEIDAIGGLTSPADKSLPEFRYTNIDYKVKGTDNSYTTGRQLTVDGMNWMVKYNTDPRDRWGGLPGVKPEQITSSNPAGFWRTGKFHGRHVMVDPDGNIAMLHGMNGVAPDIIKEASSALSQKEFKARFGTDFVSWARWANEVLVGSHFNFCSTNMNRVIRYKDFITADIEDALHNYSDAGTVSQVELALLLRTFSWDYYTASHSQRGYNSAEVNIAALMFDPYYLDYI